MRWIKFLRALVVTSAIFVLYGCNTTPTPQSGSPVAVPNTITPDASAITNSTAANVVLLQTISGHSETVLDVAFSAGGELLASSSHDMTIKLWDVETGQEVHSFQMRSVDIADIEIYAAGNLLASAEAIWDLESMEEIYVLERGYQLPASVAFSPDGAVLALGLFEEQISLWDVTSGQLLSSFARQEENRTKRMDFSADGALLAVGVIDGTVRVLDVASREMVQVLHYGGETDIHDLAFSPDGVYLATGGRIPAIILWDASSWEVVRTYMLTDNAISLDFSPDGTVLASAGGSAYEVRLWDVESGNLLLSLPHNDQLTSIAFSPDGRFIAVGSYDSSIYLYGIPANP